MTAPTASRPVGSCKCATALAEASGLPVGPDDITTLAGRGLLTACGQFKGNHLYAVSDVLALAGHPDLPAIVERRRAWVAASVSAWDAPEYLGLHRTDFRRVAKQRGLVVGDFDRYARADLDALRDDADLAEQVRADQLLTAAQAATYLEIRETDFRWLLAADLLAPHKHTWVEVTRYREVCVPLYRTGDLDALREHPAIDWEAVHAVRPGERSPLRELARRPVDRAAVIRRGIADLGHRLQVEMWAWWNNATGGWEVDYARRVDGPTVAELRAAIAAHPTLGEHRETITVATRAGAAIRWARAMREPNTAVILDTETTGLAGYIVEVAVIDAATGDTLLNTLVNPHHPVEPEARWVHGIDDDALTSAPELREIWPQLLAVTAGKRVLAYNADFDAATLARHAHRDGLALEHLDADATWSCLMDRRSAWLMRRRWLPLGGGHRALGDCQSAYELLCAMVAPATQPKALRRR